MDGHRAGAEDHHEIDRDFIESWHFPTAAEGLNSLLRDHHVMVMQWLMPAKSLI
jgi:hypothetical protein